MTSTPIAIQQFLYGYRDGHRQLAGSSTISPIEASRLLVASDLAPGVHESDVDYLTGIPLYTEQQFALMRTWSAPELPRPGCVWTHVLLIPFADLARFVDLGVLRDLFRRPRSGANDLEHYGQAIHILPEAIPSKSLTADSASRDVATQILDTFYLKLIPRPLPWQPSTSDVLFAVWSQQWPRLRRNFSFRTASADIAPPKDLRIWLTFSNKSPEVLPESRDSDSEHWAAFAAEDIFKDQPSEFRKFLWRYGSDVVDGRKGFLPLLNLFLQSQKTAYEAEEQCEIVAEIFQAFPEDLDARLVKTDLLSLQRPPYSRLPVNDRLGIWRFLILNPRKNDWDDFIEANPVNSVRDVLDQDFIEAAALARHSLDSPGKVGKYFLGLFAHSVSSDEFWELAGYQGMTPLVLVLAENNAELLDSNGLTKAPATLVVTLLRDVRDIRDDVIQRVVKRLLLSPHRSVIETLMSNYAQATMSEMAQMLSNRLPASAWQTSFTADAPFWIRAEFLTKLSRGRALERFMMSIAHDMYSIAHIGTKPWADVRRSTSRFLNEIYVDSFLMILALRCEDATFHHLVENSFYAVYEGITNREIPDELFDSLLSLFPAVPITRVFDNCYGLSLAVAQAFARHDLPIQPVLTKIPDNATKKQLKKLYQNAIGRGGY